MNGGTWYVRQYGKVLGPFTWEQVRAMRTQGQLGSFSELSQDRTNWAGLARFPEFAAPPALKRKPAAVSQPRAAPPRDKTVLGIPATPPGAMLESLDDDNIEALESFPPTAPSAPQSLWYYAIEEQQFGPVPLHQLQQMLDRGELLATDMVWEQGSPDWLPVAEVPELGGKAPLPPWVLPAACAGLLLLVIIVIIVLWSR